MPRERPAGQRMLTRDLWPVVPPLLGTLVGLGILATGDWRPGLLVIGAAVALAGVIRLVLPDRLAGLLGVRRRWFDVVVLLLLGAAIVVVALLR